METKKCKSCGEIVRRTKIVCPKCDFQEFEIIQTTSFNRDTNAAHVLRQEGASASNFARNTSSQTFAARPVQEETIADPAKELVLILKQSLAEQKNSNNMIRAIASFSIYAIQFTLFFFMALINIFKYGTGSATSLWIAWIIYAIGIGYLIYNVKEELKI